MSELILTELHVYPIKSLAGISLKKAEITDRGLLHDRRWVLVDEKGVFISQRTCPKMALLQTSIKEEGILVQNPESMNSILIPFWKQEGERLSLDIWDRTCEAVEVGREEQEFFEKELEIKCRLFYQPNDSWREVNPEKASESTPVSFADGYPFLIAGEASLNELNKHLETPARMDRFRPNFVFSGGAPFEEDEWTNFQIGQVNFKGVKPCARCPIVNVNQQTGERSKDTLKALADFRKRNHQVFFGQNLIHNGEGILTIGDSIRLL